MLANHRTPNDSWGDLHAMYGSLQVGRRRLEQLMEERGTDLVTGVFSGIQDYTEAALRENIRALPDGVYHGMEWFDDDGITATPYAIRLSLIVDGDEIVFDYSPLGSPGDRAHQRALRRDHVRVAERAPVHDRNRPAGQRGAQPPGADRHQAPAPSAASSCRVPASAARPSTSPGSWR
ncbi:hypothetical protein GCM10018952_33140 [Streptosporangium vulgare]